MPLSPRGRPGAGRSVRRRGLGRDDRDDRRHPARAEPHRPPADPRRRPARWGCSRSGHRACDHPRGRRAGWRARRSPARGGGSGSTAPSRRRAPAADAPGGDPPTPAAESASGHRVTAPSVGLFWRSPKPGAPPFVEVGDRVAAGRHRRHRRGDEADEPGPRRRRAARSSRSTSDERRAGRARRRRCLVHRRTLTWASLRRVLVANRGEIAVRIIRACPTLGIETVVAVSDADRDSLRRAPRRPGRVHRPGPAPAESYLGVGAIGRRGHGHRLRRHAPRLRLPLRAARAGRGLREDGLDLHRPARRRDRDAAATRSARASSPRAAGVPVVPGRRRSPTADERRRARPSEIGYPVLLKAAAGGGGRGMALVDDAGRAAPPRSPPRPARPAPAFGDGRGLPRALRRATPATSRCRCSPTRHGRVVHLGERDCSVQRRHQKLIEEAPAADAARRHARATSARGRRRASADALGYVGAGTVEFLVDVDRGEFSFLEMNTRIQVEHPVTEMVTGRRHRRRAARGSPRASRCGFAQADVAVHRPRHRVPHQRRGPGARASCPSPGRIDRWDAARRRGRARRHPLLRRLRRRRRTTTRCWPS